MKNDKRRYNRINKKRIFILICSIMLVIFEIVAFRNSRAEKVIDITASIIDDGGVVPTEQIPLEAKSSDSSGYYFVLPEYINNKKIDSYIVTEQVIHEKEDSSKTSIVENVTEESKSEQQNVEVNNVLTNEISEQENEKNVNISVETQNVEVQNVTAQSTEQISNTMISTNTIENTISSESTNSVMEKNEQDIKEEQQEEEKSLTTLKSPGDTLYLTDKEASSKQIELKVNYSTIQKNEDTLYDQTLQAEVDNEGDGIADCLIKIEGFMPLNASVSVKIITMDEIEKPIGTMLSDKVSFKKAYDIKILSDDKEYEPTDFDTNVKVTITGVDAINENKQKYKVVHIENEEKATEVTGVKTTNDEISFPAESFSVYAVLLEDGVQATSLYTNNMDGASVWDGSSASGFRFGEGTKEYPYLISNAEELSYFANRVNSGTSYDGVYFELIADINLNKMEWTPIGDYSNPFKGIFNGAGHTVANAIISLPTSLPTSVSSYGLFGSIGDSTNKTVIKNLQVDNFSIELNARGNVSTSSTAKGYNIGIITGTIYNNSEIKNVIVNNSEIKDNYSMTFRNNSVQLFVGGIAGLAVNSRTSTSKPNNMYAIENCYSNTNVNLDTALYYSSRNYAYYAMGQYAVGGIIGAIRAQGVWPENCLFKGQLNATNGFTGPIFGYVRNNSAIGNSYDYQDAFDTLWQGNDAGRLTMSSYFTEYSTNNQAFSNSVASGTSYERSSSSYWGFEPGYVQGVNKGLYTSQASNMLSNFNSYVNQNATQNYLKWNYYSNSDAFYFTPELTATLEKDVPKYTIKVNDNANTGYTEFKWYINNTLNNDIAGNTAIIESTWNDEKNVEVLVTNGRAYAMVSFAIERLEIHVSFEMNNQTGVLTAGLEGTGTSDPNFNPNDYTYKWFALDIAEEEQELEGETTNKISNLENGMDYKVIATNTKYDYMSATGIYTYGNRTVIYCSYDNGNDYNDGFTPNTPVRTLSTAYGKFSSETTRNENVIVLMGNYTDSSYLNSETSNTYKKNVSITGRYHGTDYKGVLYFESYDNYRYLNGNTTFMYLTFKGCESRQDWWGNISDGSASQTYFYLQGYSLTMGEGIKMERYATSNTNQGLIEGSAPAFHMFAGWLQYDETRLPRTGAEIVIKSGTYGRILLGGSSGTSSASSITKYNSHNFMGTSLTGDLYKSKITVDIKNSTTPSNYTYDINLLGGGSTCGNIYGDIELNIKNGKIGRLLGASIGDSSYRPNNWQYPINTYIGTATINMTGGSVTEMYGGCLGRNMSAIGNGGYGYVIECDSYFYGTVNINISGGTVSKTIYGAGAGGVSGYSTKSTDVYKSYGKGIDTVVNINVTGGTIDADIYGGGYGYTNYLTANSTQTDGGTLYGNSNINISGSPTINGSIYGGGRGYDLASDKPNLAQMDGTSTITISGTPTITGNIYGAGMGLTNYAEMAKFTGTANVNINADLSTSVFGGGNIAKTSGTTNININGGKHTADIYGGGNVGILEGTSNVTINGGTSSEVYGGGNQAEVTESNVYIKGGTTANVYGGGNQAGSTTVNISISGGDTTTVYGGSNQAGTVGNTVINATGGTCTDIFGGNNEGGTCSATDVTVNGVIVNDAVYGGGNRISTENTNVNLKNSGNDIPYVFGGGKSADATTTTITITGGSYIRVFGGSNISGRVTTSNVIMNNGTAENIYGGNNEGGNTVTSNITINGGTTGNTFGGGNKANTTTTYVTVNNGKITNVFGGANQADAETSNVDIKGGNIEKAFGGSNQSGTVTTSNVTLESSETKQSLGGVKMDVTYTAVEAEEWRKNQNPGYETYVTVEIKYTNNTDTTINKWESYIYAPDSKLLDNYSSDSKITEDSGKYTINQDSRWTTGNIHSLPANGTYEVRDVHLMSKVKADEFSLTYNFEGQGNDGNSYQDTNTGFMIFGGNNKGGETTTSNVNIKSGYCYAVYGGNNEGGTNPTSNVTVDGGEPQEVYGGNNLGGENTNSKVIINSGKIQNVYGGGNKAVTNVPYVRIQGDAQISHSVYGGGNQAGINTDTRVEIFGGTIEGNAYGGGNEGTVTGNTYVHVKNATLNSSLYAGGNGTTAIVYENANVTVEGSNINIAGSVFGGGNQAATGTSGTNNSLSTVNITGGNIGKNVYGGANTSVVYGNTLTNIGYEAVGDDTLEKGDIVIGGTVFGGGEANASGSEIYDFSFISVTVGIDININGTGHDKCQIKGSIFGSGNASSTSGYSYINIKNYGSVYSPQKNISIQRADVVTMDNSAIALSGAKDRTNEYSDVDFTLSRVDELKIKNNSILYLDCGANLLKKFTSCVDENGTEVKAKVTIDEETGATTRNVDNRIYMLEGRNLNIATNEQVTAYGEVNGMTFFGLYTNSMNPATSTGLYNREYNNGDAITNAGTFSSNSYVRGLHKTDHDVTIDGFYSNYDNEDNPGYIKTKYIETTPKDDVYYIWLVGSDMDVTTFEVALTASKYATLGTYELGLTGFSTANIKFSLTGFSAGLADGISLVQPSQIESVELDEKKANSVFGLTMKTGNNGWSSRSSTTFLTENGGTYTGATTYNKDNSTFTPALNLALYHSENITEVQKLGSVKIRLQAQIPEDDLNIKVSYIDIIIKLSTALYQNDFYEGAITPGEEFGLFTTTETNITDSSVFSTYYSLYIPEFSTSDYYEKYSSDKRVLTSRKSTGETYVFPANTKITMIDMVTNKYYYYVVSSADENSGKYVYNLKDFVVMGSDNTYYDEAEACSNYYNKEKDLIYENFIFHIDFSENYIDSNIYANSLLMELRDSENQTLLGVLGIQRDTIVYSVYKNKDAKINVTATTNKDIVYRGNSFNLTVLTDFKQDVDASKTIYDTQYFDSKMGIKISIYDSNGNRLNSDTLLGVSFELDGIKYYPRIDGTVRICTAEKVSNVLSRITVDTKNNTVLATGDYTIRVESFGSPDGIYYGIESSDTAEVKITIIESTFGLNVYTGDNEKIVEKDTGFTQNGNGEVIVNIEYMSSLENPNMTISLYRRDYSSIYSQTYELVDLADYLFIAPTKTKNDKEYVISKKIDSNMTYTLGLTNNLVTGTYKIVIKLYDNDEYIGEGYEYLIIK